MAMQERILTDDRGAGTWALALHLATLIVGAILLVRLARDQWFFGDEWDFIASRGFFDAERSLWAPHNEHWSTIPIVIYRGLLSVFGLRSYLPYMGVLFALHLLLAHLIWRVMRRAGVDGWVAAALVAAFVVGGAGAENILWAFQVGFVGSVVFGVGALLTLDGASSVRGSAVAAGLLATGLMFSGMVLPFVPAAGFLAWRRRGLRQAGFVVGVPLTIFATWFLLAGSSGVGAHPFELARAFDVPRYVLTGISFAAGSSLGVDEWLGGVALVGLTVWFALRLPLPPRWLLTIVLAGTSVLVYVLVAPGRVALGIEQARASRYVYIAWALLLPALGVLASTVGRRAIIRIAVLALIGLIATHGWRTLVAISGGEAAREQAIRDTVLAAAAIGEGDEQVLGGQPDPRYSPDLTIAHLEDLVEAGYLPEEPEPSTAAFARAAVQVQVSLGSVPQYRVVSSLEGDATAKDGGRCRARPASGSVLMIEAASPLSLPVSADATASIRVRLAGDGARSGPRLLEVPDGGSVFLNLASTAFTAILTSDNHVEVGSCALNGA